MVLGSAAAVKRREGGRKDRHVFGPVTSYTIQVDGRRYKDTRHGQHFRKGSVVAHRTFFKIYAVEIGHQFRAWGIIWIGQYRADGVDGPPEMERS